MEFHGPVKLMPTGSTGDVPTQQADGTLAMATPSGGGGSLPKAWITRIGDSSFELGSANTWVDVEMDDTDRLEVTSLGAGDYLVTGFLSLEVGFVDGVNIEVRVVADGTASSFTVTYGGATDDTRRQVVFQDIVTLTGTNKTIKIQVRDSDADTIVAYPCSLVVQEVDLQ